MTERWLNVWSKAPQPCGVAIWAPPVTSNPVTAAAEAFYQNLTWKSSKTLTLHNLRAYFWSTGEENNMLENSMDNWITFSHGIWKCYIWIVGILLPKGFQLWRAHRVQLRLIRIKICPKLGEEKTFARVETVTGFNQVGGQNSSHLLPKHLIETR